MFKAIITKYWMSQGPKLVNAELCHGDTGMIRSGDNLFDQYYKIQDWRGGKRGATDDILTRYMKRKVALKKAIETLDKKRDRALKMIEEMDIL